MPPPAPTKEQIANWLLSIQKDREWLANQCGIKKSTLDSWFSTAGFPPWGLILIARLIRESHPAPEGGGTFAVFTAEEFEEIETARAKSGHPSRPVFYRDAVLNYARAIIDNTKKVVQLHFPLPTVAEGKAAEEPKEYKTKRKG